MGRLPKDFETAKEVSKGHGRLEKRTLTVSSQLNVITSYSIHYTKLYEVAEMIPGLRMVRGVEKLVCPPFTALMAVSRLIKDTDIRLGAQDMFWEDKGAFTGEISAPMLAVITSYSIHYTKLYEGLQWLAFRLR